MGCDKKERITELTGSCKESAVAYFKTVSENKLTAKDIIKLRWIWISELPTYVPE